MLIRGFRRGMHALRFPMAAVLPVWLLLGYALHGGGGFGGLVGVVLLAPLVSGVEIALSLLSSSRAEVRRTRMLEPQDAVVLAVFQLAVVGFGCFAPSAPWFGLLAVVTALGGLGLGVRRLADDVRTQPQRLFGVLGPRAAAGRAPLDAGEYVVVKRNS